MRKKICIISTGGTILGSLNDSGYTSAKLDFNDVFSSLLGSEFSKNLELKILEPFSVGSQDMSFKKLLILMQTIKQNISSNDAIIITHGTDTMEESAFLAFLLFEKAKIPIIFCGAMYPPQHMLFDGEKNLKFALISSLSCSGVFVAMNESLIKANEVIKLKSVGADAFVSIKSLVLENSDPAGRKQNLKSPQCLENSENSSPENSENSSPENSENLKISKNSENSENSKISENSKNKSFSIFNFSIPKSLANVAVIYADSTFEPFSIEADGIVLAGMGAGTLNQKALEFFEKSKEPVVRSSRCALCYVSSTGEVAKSSLIPSFHLSPAKAKILLSLALANKASKKEIKKYFEFFA